MQENVKPQRAQSQIIKNNNKNKKKASESAFIGWQENPNLCQIHQSKLSDPNPLTNKEQ